ncbi:LapA family protein [Xenorhabdus nematophila]|uniref:Lipopolysaccharide assembly protein A n=1 Tax=Xenorhabdus nematophila (strain ATCC 19061 / DSM 3370 / CCUG 14189 / LMG 1036 / NCIMB 9965 / AN6) TaxID=406817 RepID=D3VGN6_XENNA|nr:LapA family protein [Xenorhabdus nematophila]CEE92809.1 Inner membrane protein yciS [Xenorhabdus nematophila str. Anatoliense]CEF32889.1 Inner membrane protein yciS [Xenorhabdus nematophila str. Websteri]AYA40156.1 LapA family protein [Xenorhabdus nematophila]KHD28302.1 membrane protein [Xenorhabdus nematophila]MBA0018804.1 LapA family protein [Xenorhabdus nematophila]
MKYFLILLLALVVFVISVTLGANNNQIVTFNYLIAKGDYSISTLLAALFAIGFTLGWAICGAFYLRTRISLQQAKRKIKRLETQLDQSTDLSVKSVPTVALNKE